MSRELGLATLRLEPTPRLAHTEYIDSDTIVSAVTGKPGNWLSNDAFVRAWDLDLLWHSQDGPTRWSTRGRTTDLGHAAYVAGGTDQRPSAPSPFNDLDEVLAFDPVVEYGLEAPDALAAHYQAVWRRGQDAHPTAVFTGGYYKTLITGALESFGWDWLLLAATDPDAFDALMERYLQFTLHHYRAWAKTSCEVFISHDDIVWGAGPFMKPAIYRRSVLPRLAELWRVLKAEGKIVLWCCDGNCSMFLDEMLAAGADGVIIEPCVPLEPLVARWGSSKVIVGSKVDCRTMAFGTPEAVEAEIDATLPLAQRCPGFVFAVGNHIPDNVPVATATRYIDRLRQGWRRA